ncbi:MAG TPA: methyl-accepting chemotaxis protein [Firmicutes bacterium]|nr:methyl-accepting chemotaxis protein [Bacillota bacterium]
MIRKKNSLSFMTKMSIRKRLIIVFLLVSLVPLCVIGSISYFSSRSALSSKAAQYSMDSLVKTGYILEMKLAEYADVSLQMQIDRSLNETISNYVKAENDYDMVLASIVLKRAIERYLYADEGIAGLMFLGETEKHFVALGSIKLQPDFRETEFYAQVLSAGGRVVWASSPYVMEDSDQAYILAGRLIEDLNTGRPLGVFLTFVSEESIDRLVNYSVYQEPDIQESYFMLISRTGQIAALPKKAGKEHVGKDLSDFLNNSAALQEIIGGGAEKNALFTGLFKENVLLTVGRMGSQQQLAASSWEGQTTATAEELGTYDWYLLGITPTSYLYQEARSVGVTTLILGVIFGGGAVLLSLLVAFNISDPLARMVKIMKKVENGDMTARVEITNQDELGFVGKSFNRMLENTNRLLANTMKAVTAVFEHSSILEQGSEQSAQTAESIARAFEDINKGTMEQTIEAEKSSKLMIELAEKIDLMVNKSGEVGNITSSVKTMSVKSKDAVSMLMDKAKETDRITADIIKDITELHSSVEEIRNITDVIVNIAEQTNLLALNASIEAARAGEAGRGFAVVAEEVNKLAAHSQEAGRAINHFLQTIETKTTTSTQTAERAYEVVREQRSAVSLAQMSFDEIITAMDNAVDQLTVMNTIIDQINGFKEQTVQSIISISAISEETAAATEQVFASCEEQTSMAQQVKAMAEELQALARTLVEITSSFKATT